MNWLGRLLHRNTLEEQLEKELRFHIEEDAAARIVHGQPSEEAYRLARLNLGGPEQVKEQCRDARGTRWLEDLGYDVRYALRTLRQRPGFAGVALLTLALGIGATSVMFTVIDGVLFKPFGYRDPDRLLRLREQTDWSTPFGNVWGFTYPNLPRRQTRVSFLGRGSLESSTRDTQRAGISGVHCGSRNVVGSIADPWRGCRSRKDVLN
jgi:hypothetical protein